MLSDAEHIIAALEAKVKVYEQVLGVVIHTFCDKRDGGVEEIDLLSKHLVAPLLAEAQPPYYQAVQRLADIVQQVRERLRREQTGFHGERSTSIA